MKHIGELLEWWKKKTIQAHLCKIIPQHLIDDEISKIYYETKPKNKHLKTLKIFADAVYSKYIRITNTDSANVIEIGVITSATNYQVTLSPGQSHVLGAASGLMLAEASNDPSFGTMADLKSIEAQAVSTAATVEVYIASTAG